MMTTKINAGRLVRFVSLAQGGFERKPLCPLWLNGIGCLLSVLLLTSCGKETLAPKEYVNFIRSEKSGLLVSKTIDGFEFSLLYKPCEYIALMQDKDENISKIALDEKIKLMQGMQYYTFTIKTESGQELMREGISAENEYYERLDYIVSYMQNDLSLIDGKDTLPCALFHYERNYNVAPQNNFVLGFEKPKSTTGEGANNATDKTLVFNDQILGIGKLMLTINSSAIQNIPQLKLTK